MAERNPTKIYLGDIDPNLEIGDPINIRRNIIYKLLLWDNIILSDSQILTDPRISLMMSGGPITKGAKSPFEPWQMGFECLLTSGAVKVACRSSGVHTLSLPETWSSMHERSKVQSVPYLPPNDRYAKYLDSIIADRENYNLSRMSSRYKQMLLHRIDTVVRDESDSVGCEFRLLIEQSEPVLFRDILKFLNSNLSADRLNNERYIELYRYARNCYHVNLPTETGCLVSLKVENIPMHLETAKSLRISDEQPIDSKKVRPTWVFNPTAIDHLPTSAILDIRAELERNAEIKDIIQGYNLGQTPVSPTEYYDAWETYIDILEGILIRTLHRTKEELDALVDRKIKFERKKTAIDLLKCASGHIPIWSEISAAIDAGVAIRDFVSCNIMQNRNSQGDPEVYRAALSTYLSTIDSYGLRIITKYDSNMF